MTNSKINYSFDWIFALVCRPFGLYLDLHECCKYKTLHHFTVEQFYVVLLFFICNFNHILVLFILVDSK